MVPALVNIKKKQSVWKVVYKTTLVLLESGHRGELSKSAIADHAVQYNHVIDWNKAKIPGKECNTNIRRIRESMWIRRKGPQAMKREEGAHFLSHVFDPFLTGSTLSTVGVHPTGKKKDRSTSF